MKQPAPTIGYLVSRYPAVSHTFILREVARLRRLGLTIRTCSVNPPDRSLDRMDAAERAEAEATYCLKDDGVPGALSALAWCAARAPRRLLRTVAQGWRARGLRGLAYAAEAAMVARWMDRNGLENLHVHFGNAGATVGMLVKTLNGCHLSYTIHGPDEFDDVPGQCLPAKMHAADAVVCISQFARSQLMRLSEPADWAKFTVCRLGVDPEQFTYAPRTPSPDGEVRLLCVGRLCPAKAQVLLVEACARLRAAGTPVRLTLVGDGPDRARIEHAVRARDLEHCVRLTGALRQDEVRAAIAEADIFVLPSLAEGIPVVLMEAMSSGLPCVSTRVNGIPELIEHDVTGLLATPGDSHSLAAQLHRLARDPQLRARLAEAARHKVERHFHLDVNVLRLSKVFASFPRTPDFQPTSLPALNA